MKFLANENFPKFSVNELRRLGYDVSWICELSPGISDKQVLQMAEKENRVVLTFDSDYGELVYFRGVPCPAGIIYLRFHPTTPIEPAERVHNLLSESGLKIPGGFFVLDRVVIRRRNLPTQEN